MGKSITDAVLDAQLAAAEGDAIHVCAGQPTNYTEASSTNKLASGVMGAGNYTKANGDSSGRKNTIASPADLPIDASGIADHVALTSGTDLKQVTTCTAQTLTSGGQVTPGSYDHEIGDPV